MLSYFSCVDHGDRPSSNPLAKACFATQYSEYSVMEIVYFNNCSSNAESYSWDFGDGTYSTEKHPNHTYISPGIYQVILTANGIDSQTDSKTEITIIGSTDLYIFIMHYGTDDPVSDCNVTIYGSEDDWQNFTNPIIEGNTNNEGNVIFTQLDTVIYYIDAYKGVDETHYYSNEQQGYITNQLVKDEINEYNVYVELLISNGDKLRTKKDDYIIRKIEKRK